MAFSEDELVQLENVFMKALKPIEHTVQEHDQTLYGINRQNGLRKKVEEHSECISDLKGFKRSVIVVTTFIQVIGAGVISFLGIHK